MPTFNVKVTAVGNGDQANLGTAKVVANTAKDAEPLALDELWDARLDCAGCVPEFETTLAPKYLVSSDWRHIFERFGECTVRFVFDTEQQQVVFMEMDNGRGWAPTTAIERADVTDSLVTANEEVLDNPEDEGLVAADELPSWAAATTSSLT